MRHRPRLPQFHALRRRITDSRQRPPSPAEPSALKRRLFINHPGIHHVFMLASCRTSLAKRKVPSS